MQYFYCAKCGGEATKPGIPGSGYCEGCRKLLRLNPAKLNDVLEIPEAAVIINGEVVGPMDRIAEKLKKVEEMTRNLNETHLE